MKVMYIAAECKPFSQAGGVADVAGELPIALEKLGVDIEIVTPYYNVIDSRYIEEFSAKYDVSFHGEDEKVKVFKGKLERVPVFFIDNSKYFGGNFISILSCLSHIEVLTNAVRESLLVSPSNFLCNVSEISSLSPLSSYSHPYVNSQYIPYYDDILRFSFFCYACIELIKKRKPDIVHINDWMLGYLFGLMEIKGLKQKRVLSIHNIAYQGVIGIDTIRKWEIEEILNSKKVGKNFLNPSEMENRKSVNALALGIQSADMVNTVSKAYCEEIMMHDDKNKYFEGGNGLEKIIRKKHSEKKLLGILNGFDYKLKNTDSNFKKVIIEKQRTKSEICKVFSNPDAFLLGFVGRAVEQKFILLTEYLDNKSVLEHLLDIEDVNIAILATGIPHYEYFIRSFTRDNYSYTIAFDRNKAKQISSGCDLFLMPSLFEPCGITQMESMSNATLPLVRLTGGLKDTVKPYTEETVKGVNGFGFDGKSREDLLKNFIKSVKEAKNLFFSKKKQYRQLQRNAFNARFLWKDTAKEYIDNIYKKL